MAWTYPATPGSVREARRGVAAWLRRSPATDALMAGDIAIALSEACTNAVIHAYVNGDGSFDVTASRDCEAVTVVVGDRGRGMIPRPDSPGLGLGVPLIASLTDSVSVCEPADGTGTVVTMCFSAQATRDRAT